MIHGSIARPTCILAFLVIAMQANAASDWHLSDCNALETAKDAELRTKLSSQGSKSVSFVPHPFPSSDSEVVANARHHLEQLWGSDKQLENERSRLLEALGEPSTLFTVLRVVDWNPSRCGYVGSRLPTNGHFFVVRVFREQGAQTGAELGRVLLMESGILQHCGRSDC